MYPIALASLVAMAVFIERLFSLRQSRVLPQNLISRVHTMVLEQDLGQARHLCETNPSPIAALFANVIKRKEEPLPFLKESIEEQGRHQAADLERFVSSLGTIASITPLLGLLGTVLGIISTFKGVARAGFASPADMADGIWVALLTTAFGLIVGIPALLGYRFLLGRIDKIVLSLERETLKLIEMMKLQRNS